MTGPGRETGAGPDGWAAYLAFTRALREARARWQPRQEYPKWVRTVAGAVMYDVAAYIFWDAPFTDSPENRFEWSLFAVRRAAYEFCQGNGDKSSAADLRELATLMGASDPKLTLDEGALMGAVLAGNWATDPDRRDMFGRPRTATNAKSSAVEPGRLVLSFVTFIVSYVALFFLLGSPPPGSGAVNMSIVVAIVVGFATYWWLGRRAEP